MDPEDRPIVEYETPRPAKQDYGVVALKRVIIVAAIVFLVWATGMLILRYFGVEQR